MGAPLVNTELMAQDGDAPRPSVAGVLLFGSDPARFLPQHGITAVAFRGIEKDYDFHDRARLQAPLTRSTPAASVSRGWSGRRSPSSAGPHRRGWRSMPRAGAWSDPSTPPEVVREAVANAVGHRDYLLGGTDVEFALYEDRLEVISPGRLPNGITPERMRAGTRSARNQLLKDVLRDYGIVDHLGLGVPRKIVAGMRAHNGTEVELIEQDERFLVRLFIAAREGRS